MQVTRRQGLIGTILAPFADVFTKYSGYETLNPTPPVGGLTQLIQAEKPSLEAVVAERTRRLLEEKKQLQALLRGELSEYHKRRMDREYDATFEDIRSLKSVTKATKERMLLKHKKKKEMESWLAEWKFRLGRLMGIKDVLQEYNVYGDTEPQTETKYDERNSF